MSAKAPTPPVIVTLDASAFMQVVVPEFTVESYLTRELGPWHTESWVAAAAAEAVLSQRVAQGHFDMAREWLDEGETELGTVAQQLAAIRYADGRDCRDMAMAVSRRLSAKEKS